MTAKEFRHLLTLSLSTITLLLAETAAAVPSQPSWGSAFVSTYTVAFTGFVPMTTFTVNNFEMKTGGIGTVCTDGAGGSCHFSASVSLPGGAKIVGLDLEACDITDQGSVSLTIAACPTNTGGCSPIMTVVSADTGCVRTTSSPLNTTVNNEDFYYVLLATIADTTVSVGARAARVHYQLQISPAPATATFSDVPTNHIYFRAVEALAASGITQGCGSGNFCPDGTVTRGEVAVFLARALGLAFPN